MNLDPKAITDLGSLGVILLGFLWLLVREMPEQRKSFRQSLGAMHDKFNKELESERKSRGEHSEAITRAIDKNTSATEHLSQQLGNVCKGGGRTD